MHKPRLEYEGLQRRKLLTLVITMLLLCAAVVISAGTGSIKLTPWEVLSTLFGGGDSRSHMVLFENRLPRTVAAILVGAC